MVEIANATGGVFTPAPLKHLFRAFEKTAMRAEKDRRYEFVAIHVWLTSAFTIVFVCNTTMASRYFNMCCQPQCPDA